MPSTVDAAADAARDARDALSRRVPPPTGASLVVALALAAVVVGIRSSVRVVSAGHAENLEKGPQYFYSAEFSFFPAYSGSSMVDPEGPEHMLFAHPSAPMPMAVPPSPGALALGLLAVAAAGYVALQLLLAVAGQTGQDGASMASVPSVLTPTWPSLALVVAVVGADAVVPEYTLLFDWLYQLFAVARLTAGVSWRGTVAFRPHEAATVPTWGVAVIVTQALLALLVTYLLACAVTAAVRSRLSTDAGREDRSNRAHI